MDLINDLALVLKSFRYGERDMVVVMFTEHHGKVTGMAKGAVHSRRYGGALQFLAASQVRYVRKPHAEMARIDEAVIRHEFKTLPSDMTRLSVAAFFSEFCMKLTEPEHPMRELFVILSNSLMQLDQGRWPLQVLDIFLVKALRTLGYAPNLTHCSVCALGADQLAREREQDRFFFDENSGSLLCARCLDQTPGGRSAKELPVNMILLFCDLATRGFKELDGAHALGSEHLDLYRLLSVFMHQHIPAVHAGGGLKTLQVIDEADLLQPLAATAVSVSDSPPALESPLF